MFKMTLVTPEKKLLLGQEVESVMVPAFKGELNILAGHTPLVTTLETGIVKWKNKGESDFHHAVVSWGYCEIHPDGVDILAEIADVPSEINADEANASLEEKNKKLATATLNDEEFAEVSRQIQRLKADLEIVKFKN